MKHSAITAIAVTVYLHSGWLWPHWQPSRESGQARWTWWAGNSPRKSGPHPDPGPWAGSLAIVVGRTSVLSTGATGLWQTLLQNIIQAVAAGAVTLVIPTSWAGRGEKGGWAQHLELHRAVPGEPAPKGCLRGGSPWNVGIADLRAREGR